MQEQENTDGDGQTQASLFRAAQYVRMSTEHQQYSTENQADKIVNTPPGAASKSSRPMPTMGKSGLRIDGRQALQQLIGMSGRAADFQIILVYDVSRWGRFPGRGRKRLLRVHLAAAPAFRSPIAPSSSRTTARPCPPSSRASKRAMAGENSRELSAKVFAGSAA